MSAFNIILLSSVFVIVALLIFILAFPQEASRIKRKKEKPQEPKIDNSQWEEKIAKLEKHIATLKAEMEALRAQEAKALKEFTLEKEKVAGLEEKLSKEKEWLNKEEEAIGKRDKDILDLKNRLLKSEGDFEREYSTRLRQDQQLKEFKASQDESNQEKRNLALKVAQLEAELKAYKDELAKQKNINAELAKKNDETAWVAKAEYDRVAKLLQEKEHEITRISKNNG